MSKLLIDLIETVDNISHKIIKGKNGYYLPKITSDQLSFERQLQSFSGEASPDSRLNIAIKKSQTHLLGEQDETGFWAGVLEGDVALTAEYLMLMHFLKRIDTKKQEKAIRYIIKKQGKDGGWSIYHDGDSDVSISVKCYFALKLAGHSDEEPYMQKAKRCILKLGGIMKCNTFTKIYLAIFGQFDWRGIPALPVEIILLPRFFYFNIYEMSYWSRCIVVPLGIIMAKRPSSLIGDKAVLDGLYVIPKKKVSYRLKRDQNKLTIKNMFINFDTILRRYENQPIHSIRKMAIDKAEKWMLERLEKSGGLGAIWPSMVNSLMAMKCLGYEDGNPIVEKAIEDIEALAVHDVDDTMFLQPCVSPVWDTPWAIMALLKSGLPNNHPALVKAGEWMLEKEVKSFGDWSMKNPVREPSGWYFQHANEFYPDNDDASVVMMSLQLLDLPEKDRKRQAILRGFKWLMGMQCNDGGWGSFDKNNNKKILNNIPFADWNALLDPSTSDLTARVLDLMGKLGYDLNFPPAKRAIEFLKKEQEKNGSWFGRWGTNYVYGTWSVLSGLFSIKEDMTKDYVRKAASWLIDFQNEDGGWGETCKSYWDTSLSAIGRSTASQTSWAVLGLFCTKERDSEAVSKGIEYLIKTQKEDGTWDEEEFTGTGFPKIFYLRYHMYRSYFPLLALSKYRNMIE